MYSFNFTFFLLYTVLLNNILSLVFRSYSATSFESGSGTVHVSQCCMFRSYKCLLMPETSKLLATPRRQTTEAKPCVFRCRMDRSWHLRAALSPEVGGVIQFCRSSWFESHMENYWDVEENSLPKIYVQVPC